MLTLTTLMFVLVSIVLLALPAAHPFYRAARRYRIARRPVPQPMLQRPPYIASRYPPSSPTAWPTPPGPRQPPPGGSGGDTWH